VLSPSTFRAELCLEQRTQIRGGRCHSCHSSGQAPPVNRGFLVLDGGGLVLTLARTTAPLGFPNCQTALLPTVE
jgi:hypothetical protein